MKKLPISVDRSLTVSPYICKSDMKLCVTDTSSITHGCCEACGGEPARNMDHCGPRVGGDVDELTDYLEMSYLTW